MEKIKDVISPKGNFPSGTDFIEEEKQIENSKITSEGDPLKKASSDPIKITSRRSSLSGGNKDVKKLSDSLKEIYEYLTEVEPLLNGRNRALINENLDKALLLTKREGSIKNFLYRVFPFLTKEDGHIEFFPEDVNSPLFLMVVPYRNMKEQTESQDKTIILINRNEVEGKGAYSKVIRAYDLMHRDILAIKLFHNIANNLSLQREISNLILNKWFFGSYKLQDGEFAIAMENIPGDTGIPILYKTDESHSLNQDNIYVNYCTQKNTLTFDFIFNSIIKITKQVVIAHNILNLVHRDLKPANIKFYDEQGKQKVRIIDWGDAEGVDSKILGDCGTDGYTHPAIWRDKKPYIRAHDVYSLGVIYGEFLTKKGEEEPNEPQVIVEEKKKLIAQLFPQQIIEEKKEKDLTNQPVIDEEKKTQEEKKEERKKLNFQQYLKALKQDIVNVMFDAPKITPEQIQEILDDVFNYEGLEIAPDQYDNLIDCKTNLQNFIILELKKLAKKMLITQLADSSLDKELERLKVMKKNYKSVSSGIEQFWNGSNLETTMNNIQSYSGSFFKPQRDFSLKKQTKEQLEAAQKEALREATERFKEVHTGPRL
ncbi:MAG: hypothetical protein H0U73_14170 [Tatlockia sp.]|nr:hypothetical protein [Tatlockia sp.]